MTLNGKKATLGDKAVPGTDVISVDGIRVESCAPLAYFVLNKPKGVVSTTCDPQGRKMVLDLLPGEKTGDLRLFPVGRLDMDSTGLILLTNDGFLANRLLHPSFEVEREYLVEVEPVPGAGDIARLRKGIELEDGDTGPSRVSLLGRSGNRGQVRMVLHAGRKRQIRRSFARMGYTVVSLSRVRIGSLRIGSLPPGSHRELDFREVRELYRRTGLDG